MLGGAMKQSMVLSLVFFLGVAGSALADTQIAPQTKLSAPPNIVILFADDLGYGDVQSYGHPYIRTPHIDDLARSGQRWTDFYVAAPVCSPSRGALLTGRLPLRSGLYGRTIRVYFPNEPGGMPEAEVTMAEALQQRGYRTGIFGKWHLGDAPHALPTRHGFDEWLGVPYSNDMDWVGEPGFEELVAMSARGDTEGREQAFARRAAKYANPQESDYAAPLISSRRQQDGYEDSVEQPTVQANLTKRYTEAAVDFIERNRDQPFLLYLPYTMPHTPLFRSSEFVGKSMGGRYGDVVEEIDWSVGQIRQALRAAGIENNTLVIFSSDNGPWLTMNEEGGRAGLLRDGKGTTFEGGMRVPTVFSWPGKLPAGVVSDIGSALDLFPTVMTLAGSDVRTGVDGMDLSDALFGKAPSPRNELAYYRAGVLYAYRYGPWKLHLITEGAYGLPPVRTEHEQPLLFNLHRDPSERFDVAAANPQIVAQIQAAVARHRQQMVPAAPLFDARLTPGGE